ncbi:MAG: hypothetical protein FJW20_03530 [Acidimicrobiia bacterium]|nr:hypothetical protein [Acidimicrobiia bacterium]
MDLLRQLLAIAFVFSLLGLLLWKFGRGQAPRLLPRRSAMMCRDRLRLTPQHSIHVVDHDGQSWLVACYPSGMRILAKLSEAETSQTAYSSGRSSA